MSDDEDNLTPPEADEPEPSPPPEVPEPSDPNEVSNQSSEDANDLADFTERSAAEEQKAGEQGADQRAQLHLENTVVELHDRITALEAELSAATRLAEESHRMYEDFALQFKQLKDEVEYIPRGLDLFDQNFPIFPAKAGATDKQWKQQSIDTSAFADMPDGKTCTSDTIPSALFDDDPDVFWLMGIPANESGTIVMKYAKIGGESGPGSMTDAVTIGDSVEGSDSADSTDWSLSGDEVGCYFWIHSRQVYLDASSQTWYAFARQVSITDAGKFIAITGETRITIDVPEACGSTGGGSP